MIEVKSTKGEKAPANPADRYRLKKQDEKSKVPFVIGLMLTGLAVYLKSLFPSWASTQQATPREEAKKDLPPERQIAQADGGTVSPITTGSVGAQDQVLGSGRPLVEVPERAKFLTIDDPALRDFFSPEPSVTVRPLEPVQPNVSFANDNNFTTPPSIPFPGLNPIDGGNGPGDGNTDSDDGGEGGTGPKDPEECSGGPGSPCDPDPIPGGGDPIDETPCGCTPPGPVPPEDEDEDDDCEVTPPPYDNRAPRINGPVYLMDVTGCAILVIGLADLLRGAFDPDGDALNVQNLKVSGGFLQQVDGAWQFKSEPFFTGPVTITYEITDGIASVAQTASFAVIRSRIEGTDGDDILLGTNCADDINGGDGDDNIYARDGDDVIDGGRGNDHIVAGAGNDTVFGGPGDDIIFGGAGNDHLHGGPGNDRIFGEEGDDIIFGDDGDDFLSGGDGNDIIFGGMGNDTIYGDAGNDILYGDEGDDFIDGGEGDDVIFDGPGADIVYGGPGNDVVVAAMDGANDRYDGGSGRDFLSYSASQQRIVVDLEKGTAKGAEIGNDTISNFEEIATGSGDDLVIDASGQHKIVTGAGDDVVVAAMDGADDVYDGGEGYDRLDYTAARTDIDIDIDASTASGEEIGDDTISSFEEIATGSGDDVIVDGQGSHTLSTGAGDDVVVAAMDGADDVYDGGEGYDRIDYTAARTDIVIDIDAGTASGEEIGDDTISNFEEIATGSGDDVIVDGQGSHTLSTGAGDDIVVAAMDGADDVYDGGEGCDTLDYSAAEECLVIDLNAGIASGIEIGNDTISGFEHVIGGAGDDHFILGSEGAILTGGAGDNTFEFLPSAPLETRHPVAFSITDFKIGDKIKMNQYKLFEKVFDEFEDQFESIFGKRVDEDDFAVRTRHEIYEGQERTVIEADFNRDDNYETTIYLQGRHVLIVFDHA